MRITTITSALLALIIGAGCGSSSEPTDSTEGAGVEADEAAVGAGDSSTDPAPETFCGGIAGIQCADGHYCKFAPEAACGAADAGGVCAPIPDACTKEYAPVCGCDGKTYGNACTAASNGVSVLHTGECADDSSGAGEGELCGGFAGISCDAGLYCAFPPEASCGSGDQSGTCTAKPELCPQIYNPVCGCDGETYSNSCVAAMNGVSVASEGACPETAAPTEAEAEAEEEAGAKAGESCGGHTAGPPPTCEAGLYCKYALGASCGWSDIPGSCAERPQVCPFIYAPVCGCDGKTYSNSCVAATNGVSVLNEGKCQNP